MTIARLRLAALATLVVALALASAAALATPPQRIVSLNVCTDQVLIALVAKPRIAAVTDLAADPTVSADPSAFAGVPATKGAAEDVLARDPDLIIAGASTTVATIDLLRRLGRRVLTVPEPDTMAGVRETIMAVAAAVEEPAAGGRLVAELDRRLAEVRRSIPSGEVPPSALIYEINNFTAGRGTLVDEALHLAGLRNAGDAFKIFASGQTSLEQIVSAPPDLMILAPGGNDATTTAADALRHPALQQLLQRVPHIVLPAALWLCGTQHIATAVEHLAAARQNLVRPLRREQATPP